jgi:tRNA (cmo5U34)-methyltransferase
MLEKMSDFFENRLEGYDEHMRTNLIGAEEFYPFTAKQLPVVAGASILDLGCGTGLELEEYDRLCPSAKITGIDLSQGMLSALRKKFMNKDITLIVGSYFDVPFGIGKFISKLNITINLLHISCIPFLFYKRRKNTLICEATYCVKKEWVFCPDGLLCSFR